MERQIEKVDVGWNVDVYVRTLTIGEARNLPDDPIESFCALACDKDGEPLFTPEQMDNELPARYMNDMPAVIDAAVKLNHLGEGADKEAEKN